MAPAARRATHRDVLAAPELIVAELIASDLFTFSTAKVS